MSLLSGGDLIFVRDSINEAIRELTEAQGMSDIYSFDDLVEILQEAILAQEALYDHARVNGMLSV